MQDDRTPVTAQSERDSAPLTYADIRCYYTDKYEVFP
jgi:hypothetical protein